MLSLVASTVGCRTEPPPPPPAPPPGMVTIPGGTFQMGSTDGERDEFPPRSVTLDPFYLDQMEVTNREFERFVQTTGYQSEGRWKRYATPERQGHPVVSVTWNDAKAYADWAGKRLPTEAEWEYAARAGRPQAVYGTGGDGTGADESKANFGHIDIPPKTAPLEGIQTDPVTSFEANPFGLYDLAGNAAEWCADWYDPHHYQVAPTENPKGPAFGRGRVVRGGSWNDQKNYLRVSHRVGLPPGSIAFVLGFRCAKDVPKPPKKGWWPLG